MADTQWLQAVQAGLAANLPTSGPTGWAQNTVFSSQAASNPDNNSAPATPAFPGNCTAFYYATDTGQLYIWNAATATWVTSITSVSTGLTAVGTTQGTALQLTARKNVVATVGATTAGVVLPVSGPLSVGSDVWIANDSGTNMQVFANGADILDALAAATGATLTAAKACFYTLVAKTGATGTWVSGPQGGHTS